MTQYAKYINETTIEFPPKNKGSIINYDQNVELLIADGYKEFIKAETEIGKSYTFTYEDLGNAIQEIATEIPQPDPAVVREEQFNRDFFQTSLGWIRRSVTMQDNEQKDFLSDLLPSIAIATNSGLNVNILAYDKPDFTQEITDWTIYQHSETVTAQFIQECFLQLQNDFIPIN